jgi:hypothetical protein
LTSRAERDQDAYRDDRTQSYGRHTFKQNHDAHPEFLSMFATPA